MQLTKDQDYLIGKVREIVAEALDMMAHEINLDSNLFESYGLDSVGIVFVHVEMAIEFGLEEPEPDQDLSDIDTVMKLAAYVHEVRSGA